LVKRLQTGLQLRLRYLCLAYHQDSAPLLPFVDQLGRTARSFGHARACRTKAWRSSPICCHWIGQPQVDQSNRGELDFTRRLEED
jgi:hypothetical protein